MAASPRCDFFISYTAIDRAWAERIAWALEEAGYTTIIQAWDFRPGTNFVQSMQQATAEADRTILVLSPDYLTSAYAQPEWQAANAPGFSGITAPRFPGSLPPVWNVPHDRNPNFTGREELLSDLYDSLHAGNATVLRHALRGLGGVGKTQLAFGVCLPPCG